jgi:2-dehydropantoate 2-reductase
MALRIAVMGTGGVGGYFGARLALGGCDVTFIARGAQLAALRQRGLRVLSAGGDMHVEHVTATDDPRDVGPVDVVLFGVKLWDTEDAARLIVPMLGAETAVVSLQNGVLKDEVLCRLLGDKAVIGGVAYIAATIAEPGVIRHTGAMQRLVFGERDGVASARTAALLAACQRTGITAEISADIRRAIWEKFVFLVGMSGTTSAIRMPIGAIRAHPQTRALLRDAMREVIAVGCSEGVPLTKDFVDNRLAFCDTLPAEMTSSMHQDLERGNRLEVEWLSGDVVRRGAAAGVATPVNRVLHDVVVLHANGRPSG